VPRLREIPRREVSDPKVLALYDLLFGDRDPVAQPGTAAGTRGDWWTVFAGSPDVLNHAAKGFVLDGGRVADGVFEALKAFLDDEQILELTYITCLYEMHAVMSRALRLEFDDRPETVVEVDAPEDFKARDFMDTGR
jgi:hypothetical protein